MTCLLCPKLRKENSQGGFQKNWEGVCGTLPETLTLFHTKICDFPYPISDLIKNLMPYFGPEALEPGALHRCYCTYMVGVNIKGKWSYRQMMKKRLLLKNIPNSSLECKNHTLFQTKTAKKTYPLAPHRPI